MAIDREQIIELCRKAGFSKHEGIITGGVSDLERFAALVAAAAKAEEREACAKVCEVGVDTEHPTVKWHIMKDFGKSRLLAAAIRSRGEQP